MVDDRLFKQAGLKVTSHRRAMLRILDTADGPLTAEQVYEALDPAERANLSTVYRALGTMSEHGGAAAQCPSGWGDILSVKRGTPQPPAGLCTLPCKCAH